MQEIYKNLSDKYRNLQKEAENKFNDLENIRNFYRLRRPDYVFNVLLAVSILPILITLVLSAILSANKIIEPIYMRHILIIVLLFCCFIITPVVCFIQKNKFKQYNYLVDKKTKTEIYLKDFDNYYNRLLLSSKYKIYEKTILNLMCKENEAKKEEELINKIKEKYVLSPKENVKIEKNDNECNELLVQIKEKYSLLKEELKELAFVNYFEKVFRHEFLQNFSVAIMSSMFVTIYWNLPIIIQNKEQPTTISDFALMCNLIVPIVITLLIPLLYHFYIITQYKKAFEQLNKCFPEPINKKEHFFSLKEKYEKKTNCLFDELAKLRCEFELKNNEKIELDEES